MAAWTTETLAEWTLALNAADLPDDVIAKAEDCILDAIACAVIGRGNAGTGRVGRVARREYRDGPASIWLTDHALHPTGAAFVNSTAASIYDLDDGHRRPCGHPGAAVVPAVLAVAGETGASGLETLAAVVAGYEVAARIGGAENHIAYHTGNWTGFGVAAAIARLRGLTAEKLMHALAVAAYHGPRLRDLTDSVDMGANVKESIPWSVVTGMNAVDLAAEGFTGCRDALDLTDRFRAGHAVENLGEGFQILRTYFKRYSACRWVHGAVEALLQVMDEHGFTADDIESIQVETFLQAASLDNLADPATPESAQYSVPYCLAIAALEGGNALMPLRSDSLNDAATVDLAKRVTVIRREDYDAAFPATVPARVMVVARGGRWAAFVDKPWGEPGGPTGRAELVGKFRDLAAGRLSEARTTGLIEAIETLKSGAVEPLLDLLAGPEDGESRDAAA